MPDAPLTLTSDVITVMRCHLVGSESEVAATAKAMYRTGIYIKESNLRWQVFLLRQSSESSWALAYFLFARRFRIVPLYLPITHTGIGM